MDFHCKSIHLLHFHTYAVTYPNHIIYSEKKRQRIRKNRTTNFSNEKNQNRNIWRHVIRPALDFRVTYTLLFPCIA